MSKDVNEIIDDLLAEAIEKAITEWAGQEYPNDATFYDVTVKEAKQAIKALIAQEIRIATDRAFDKFNKATLIGEKKARIDELELAVKSFEWGKGTDYLTDRIAWVKRNTPDHWAIHGDELPSASLTRALIDEDIEKCEQHIAEMEEELKKRPPNQPTKANKENDNATD